LDRMITSLVSEMTEEAAHAGTEIGAVHLKVSNLERSIRFYKEVIGLFELERRGSFSRLTADGTYPLVVLEEVPNALVLPPGRNSGLYHFALLVPTRRDLGNVLRHLLELGISVGSADHDVSEALYLSDPDGIGVEIYRDRDRSEWTEMRSGEIYMNVAALDTAGVIRESYGVWKGLPVGTRVGHVHLHVGNLAEARAFYCGLLGFRTMLQYGSSALFVAAGGYHHHVGLNIWAGPDAPPTPADATGLSHFTVVNPDPGQIERILGKLERLGISVEARGDAWYFRDPFGIGIRLTTCRIL
jgi:catechol 2,3-dioxygenase